MSPLAWMLGQCTPEERDAWVLNALALGVEPDSLLSDQEMADLGIGTTDTEFQEVLDAEAEMWRALNAQFEDEHGTQARPLPFSRDALTRKPD